MIDFPSLLFFLLCGAGLVALLIVKFGSAFKKWQKSNNTSNTVPPTVPHIPPPTTPPAPADGHTSKGGGLLRFSFNILVLGLVCLALVFLGNKLYRAMGLEEVPAPRTPSAGIGWLSPRTRPSMPTWTTDSAPSKGWLVKSVLPYHTLSHCDLATSLALCEAADPVGYRAKCTDEHGHEHLWPEPCTKTTYMSFQSKTSTPAPIRLKDNAP